MGHDFLNRIYKTSMVLSLGLAAVAAFHFGGRVGLGFGVSALWGTLSFRFLHYFVTEATRPEGVRWARLAASALIKFPLLYGGGFAFLRFARPSAVAVLSGFSLVFVVIVLKVLGRAMVDSEWFSRRAAQGGGHG